MFFATTINYVDRQVLGILATDDAFKAQIGCNEAEYGFVNTAFQAAYAIGLLVVGGLMDKFGTRRGFSFAIVFWSIASMGHSLARLIPHKQTWALAIGKFLTDSIWWVYLFWLPKFLNAKFGLNILQLGLPLIIIYVIADFGSIGGGWLSSNLIKRGWSVNAGRKTAMLICALLVVPVFLRFGNGQSLGFGDYHRNRGGGASGLVGKYMLKSQSIFFDIPNYNVK